MNGIHISFQDQCKELHKPSTFQHHSLKANTSNSKFGYFLIISYASIEVISLGKINFSKLDHNLSIKKSNQDLFHTCSKLLICNFISGFNFTNVSITRKSLTIKASGDILSKRFFKLL